MISKENIVEIIHLALDELNEQNNDKYKITKSDNIALFGAGGFLDSLGLVNLIVIIEDLLYDKHNLSVTVASEKAMSQANSPFKDVDTLATYISTL